MNEASSAGPEPQGEVPEKIQRSEAEWRQELSDEEYRVTRQAGTERAFTGRYWDCHEEGTYACVCCGAALFESDTKFDSGSGWPSFFQAADAAAVDEHTDESHGMIRTEVRCRRCDAHLGHKFPDGPKPTGQRYCINSLSLKLDPKESS